MFGFGSERDQPRHGQGLNCCGCAWGCITSSMFMLLVTLCVAVGLAVYLFRNTPTPPQAAFTPNPTQAAQFESVITEAQNNSNQGVVELNITEAQASSWLNIEAQSYINTDIPLENIQVSFRDDLIGVYGEVSALGITSIGASLTVEYRLSPEGSVQILVSDVNVSGIGASDAIKNDLNSRVQQLVDDQLNRVSGRYRVESISSQDGVLIIRGSIN